MRSWSACDASSMTAARNEQVQPDRLWPRLEALFALHHAHTSMSYSDERNPDAHARSSLLHRGWIFLCDDQAYENVTLRYGGTVCCWYMSTVAHMSGPGPDD